jgi:hypothetical protein
MPISFVGAKTAAFNTNVNIVVPLTDLKNESNVNATLQQGDLVIVTYVIGAAGNDYPTLYDVAGGYVPAHTDLFADDSNDTNLQVSYKFMGATPDASVTLPAPASTVQGMTVHVLALRGVDQTTPRDVTPTTATGINGGRPNAPAITPVAVGAWISVHGAAAGGTLAAFVQGGDLSATTNHFLSAARATTVDSAVGVGLKANWTSGPFDPAAWTGGSTTNTDSWAAVTIAWRPLRHELTIGNYSTGSPDLGTPELTEVQALAISSFSTSSPTYPLALGQLHVLSIPAYATGSPDVGSPILTLSSPAHNLAITSFSTASPDVGSPTLSQRHIAAISSFSAGSPSIGGVAISQRHSLSISPYTTGPADSPTPTLTGRHSLGVASFSTASPTDGSPSLGGPEPIQLDIPNFSVGPPTANPVSLVVAAVEYTPLDGWSDADRENRTLHADEEWRVLAATSIPNFQSADVEVRILQ